MSVFQCWPSAAHILTLILDSNGINMSDLSSVHPWVDDATPQPCCYSSQSETYRQRIRLGFNTIGPFKPLKGLLGL